MKQIIVTVGREHGSGGKYIAEQIAKQLGIAFYDKELLLDSVFNAEDAARYDEKPVHLLWSRRIGENFNAPEDALAHETFDYIQITSKKIQYRKQHRPHRVKCICKRSIRIFLQTAFFQNLQEFFTF